MTEGATTHVYEYDSLDRLIRAYQKDANGNITVAVENTYDELGRAKGSKYDKVAYNPQQYSIDYKEDSNLISAYTMPGNKVNTYTYDAFERLIQKSHSSNAFTTRFTYLSPSSGKTSTVVSGLEIDTASSDIYYSYTYDNLGNITAVYKNGVLAEAYEYDALGQLTRADNVAANSTVFYEYDKAGNIRYNFVFEYTSESTSSIAFALADSIISYQYTTSAWGDMLTRYGYNGTTVNYDAIGNPTNWRNASNLTWDARQLKTVTLSETQSLAFEYNSSGIRTRKTYTEAGGNTWDYEYILDGTRILRENIQAYPTGSPGAGIVFSLLYYYDDSGIASIDYEGTRYYYVKNLQGDVIGLVNGSGQFVVQYTYDAWGKVISTTGSMASTLGQYNPFRYRGYYYDRESGWYYLQSRYYDPTVGRFLNADGIVGANGGVQGYNLFAYCNNNPVMYADYFGQDLTAAMRATGAWAASAWWLPCADTILPICDLIFVVGLVIVFTVEYFSDENNARQTPVKFNEDDADTEDTVTEPSPGVDDSKVKDKDKRLYGAPGDVNIDGDKEAHIGDDGRADYEIHNTDHGYPKKHTNPHKHIITWNPNGNPSFGKPINMPY